MTKKKLALTLLAVCLITVTAVVPAMAYFTAHKTAQGSLPVTVGTTTTIDQISDYKQLRMFERLMAKGGEAGVEAQEGLGGGVGEDVPDVRPGAAGV